MDTVIAMLSDGLFGGALAPADATAVDTCRLYGYLSALDGTALAEGEGTVSIYRLYGGTVYDHVYSPYGASCSTDDSGYVQLDAPRGQRIGLKVGVPDENGTVVYRNLRFTVPDSESYDITAEMAYG